MGLLGNHRARLRLPDPADSASSLAFKRDLGMLVLTCSHVALCWPSRSIDDLVSVADGLMVLEMCLAGVCESWHGKEIYHERW